MNPETAFPELGEIAIYNQEHPNYETLEKSINAPRRLGESLNTPFYDEVVRLINAAKEGDIIIVPIPPKVRYANLKKLLYNRGFNEGDIDIFRQVQDLNGRTLPRDLRPVGIKKLNRDAAGRLVKEEEEEDGVEAE